MFRVCYQIFQRHPELIVNDRQILEYSEIEILVLPVIALVEIRSKSFNPK